MIIAFQYIETTAASKDIKALQGAITHASTRTPPVYSRLTFLFLYFPLDSVDYVAIKKWRTFYLPASERVD
jgi:hypothetical protein